MRHFLGAMDRWLPSDLARIKERAVQVARELGAGDVRVTAADEDAFAYAAMREAFQRGDFSTWRFGDEYARRAASPRHLLDGARSVICVVLPYAAPSPSGEALTNGRVSNYAWTADYHYRLKEVLRAVAGSIDEAAGSSVTAIACDTKPLAERAFAARAGVGWVGKHTNLIHPDYGSYVFLGEVVTTLALPADPPLRKSCGTCTRCIPACPTGALRGDYTIDATRCISDLTQRTDAIPRNLRPLVGQWVWGCDLCQIACPPNRHALSVPASVAPAPETATPRLISLLNLRSGEFKRTYARTAMGWRGAAILRRNAAVALGNGADRASVPALEQALKSDPHSLVRGHAAWALGRIGSPRALKALRRAACNDPAQSVLEEVNAALEPYTAPPALQRS